MAWFKHWQTRNGRRARVFQSTMGSAQDLECADLRRMIVNAVYWGMGLESAIDPRCSVAIVGSYRPLEAGFNYEELGVVPKPVSAYR